MKPVAIFFALMLGTVTARELIFEWDSNPAGENVTTYRLELIREGLPPLVLFSTGELTAIVPNFPAEAVSVQLVAVNALGIESLPSVPFPIPAEGAPGRPVILRATASPGGG